MLSDIDFFVGPITESTKQTLQLKEDEGMYPPRFCVVISGTPTARQSQARIEFRGAVNDLVFDVPLNPPPPQATPASPGISRKSNYFCGPCMHNSVIIFYRLWIHHFISRAKCTTRYI